MFYVCVLGDWKTIYSNLTIIAQNVERQQRLTKLEETLRDVNPLDHYDFCPE